MPKISVQIGYKSFVMDGERALQLLDTLESAEIYEAKWRNEEDGGTTHHIYSQDPTNRVLEINYLTDTQYCLYKLAGKPQD
jgi:predicted DNA-binding ArsR family transcriptional regulator